MDNDSVAYAKKYTEDLLSFFGLNIIVDASEDEEVVHIDVPSSPLNGFLIGSRAETLRAMQGIIGAALKNKGFEKNRINLDIAGYKKQRSEKLSEEAAVWMEQVKTAGQDKPLDPMNAADRRTIHQLAAEHGLKTESVGEGPDRHIVIKALTS